MEIGDDNHSDIIFNKLNFLSAVDLFKGNYRKRAMPKNENYVTEISIHWIFSYVRTQVDDVNCELWIVNIESSYVVRIASRFILLHTPTST